MVRVSIVWLELVENSFVEAVDLFVAVELYSLINRVCFT